MTAFDKSGNATSKRGILTNSCNPLIIPHTCDIAPDVASWKMIRVEETRPVTLPPISVLLSSYSYSSGTSSGILILIRSL